MLDNRRDLPSAEHSSHAHEAEECLDCGADLAGSPLFELCRICPECRFHYYLPATKRVDLLLDSGTFEETNESLVPVDPLSFEDKVPYRERLAQAQRVTGLMEGCLTGTGYVGGMPVVIAAMDFGFMSGSVGSVVGEKITLAAEMALQRRIPFLLVVCGGGPRIQEGVLSLMQMAKIVATLKRLSKRGIPFISILASPSTGALYSGAASAADIILAEPAALIGFAPLSTAKRATGGPLPSDFHTAEFHRDHGMVDRVVDRQDMKRQLSLVLDLLGFKYRLTLTSRIRLRKVEEPEAPAWDRVQRARHHERPTSKDYIERLISNFVEVHGDRVSGDDPAMVTGLGYLSGDAVMVIAQERGRGDDAARRRGGSIYPEGFRKAERAMRLAAKFRLPVVTLIDTPGAYPGLEAEERGIAAAISSTLSTISDLPTPVLAVIIGQGGSEAALALSVADRVLMMENAICTPFSPESAAWILYRDPKRADEVAAALKLTAQDCLELRIADAIIPEPAGGAHTDFDEAAKQVERMLVQALLEVQVTFTRTLLKNRYNKYRRMGTYTTYFQATLASHLLHTHEMLLKGVKDLVSWAKSRPSDAEEPPAPGAARRTP